MLKRLKKNEKGFTLVELIVVIAILAVLATLLVPRIMGNVKDAAKQTQISTARTLASEITVHNAKAAADLTGATATIPAALPTGAVLTKTLADTDITGTVLALPTGTTFPLATVVTVVIDQKGNAVIKITP